MSTPTVEIDGNDITVVEFISIAGVASVAATLPGVTFTGPVTSAGTLAGTWDKQSPNVIFAGPTSGAAAVPTWRALVPADVPAPATIAVADESTDATCFPAFFTAATGNLGPKTVGGWTFDSATLQMEFASETGRYKVSKSSAEYANLVYNQLAFISAAAGSSVAITPTSIAFTASAKAIIGFDVNGGYFENSVAGTITTIDGGNITITGTGAVVNLADNLLQRPYLRDYAEVLTANGNTTGAVNVDYSAAQNWTGTLTGNTTLTITNPPATGRVGTVSLWITGNGAANLTITNVSWINSVAPDFPIANGVKLAISMYTRDGGTNWYGSWGIEP